MFKVQFSNKKACSSKFKLRLFFFLQLNIKRNNNESYLILGFTKNRSNMHMTRMFRGAAFYLLQGNIIAMGLFSFRGLFTLIKRIQFNNHFGYRTYQYYIESR